MGRGPSFYGKHTAETAVCGYVDLLTTAVLNRTMLGLNLQQTSGLDSLELQ